ncbi:MAG: efflux RND transporter permease subunit [Chloroflexi bacterium]|nr:efflux RND transporter permease subunit [Chloroflexota bacterium]
MGLTRLAIARPLAILMLILAMVLMGAVSYTRMRVDRFPAINFPAVFVSIPYPGASPSDVEDLVAKPAENAVAGLAGVSQISSTSSEGYASLNIQFVEDADVNQAAMDVERRIAAIRGRLPDGIGDPSIIKADASALPIMNVALSGPQSLEDEFQLANDTILPRLQSADGVADVTMSGGLQREIHVEVDQQKLQAFGISLQTLQSALARENVSQPGGSLTAGSSVEDVRTQSQLKTVDDIRNLTVQTTPTPVRVRDVATVTDTTADVTRMQRYNGKDAIGFTITKQSDANSVQVADNVKATIAQLQRSLPPGTQLNVTNDTSVYTRHSLSGVLDDLQIGVILTGVVLLLFLHTWRNTLIVLLAIPTSLISTFLVMYFLGFSLDIVSLMALALTIGILVDDSIVVLENITRHLERGEQPRMAALKGRSEIGMAAIAITLVDVVVYLPVSFMSGNIGRLFREFGITIAAATLFSLFISFTLTPLLASRWLKGGEASGPMAAFGRVWDQGYERIALAYRGLLRVALQVRWLVVLVAFSLLFGCFMMLRYNLIGSEYVPTEDDGQFTIGITMPPGTSLQATDAVTRRIEALLNQIPEVQSLFTTVGSGGGFGGGSTSSRNAQIAVQLVDKGQRTRSVQQVLAQARGEFRQVPQAQIRASIANPLAGGGGGGLTIRIAGEDLAKLQDLAQQVQSAVQATSGATDVQSDAQDQTPELRAVVDRSRLDDLHLSASTVAAAVRTVVGGTVVTQMHPAVGDEVDVRVIAPTAQRTADQLASIPLFGDGGALIRLGQVAQIVPDSGPARIQRTNRQRVIQVSANVSGRSLGDVTRDVRTALVNLPLPQGYQITYAGQVQQQETAFATLLQALSLSVILVYMLMVALYESLLTPFAIMFSLPVALVGAFLGLYMTGNTFNIFSLIGTIMLMGLVGKNAILLVDFTDMLRKQGMSRTDAILQAGYIRLRPIGMTSATILFAMLPLALKLQDGGESRAPLAVVIMGGVLSSTLLTLVLVPSVYTILDDVAILVRRLLGHVRLPRLSLRPAASRLAAAYSVGGSGFSANGHAGLPESARASANGVAHGYGLAPITVSASTSGRRCAASALRRRVRRVH